MSTRISDSIQRELAYGQTDEENILRRWAPLTQLLRGAERFVKGAEFDPYDFFVFGKKGLPFGTVDTKRRRVPITEYGDVMVPQSKCDFARRVGLMSVLVTEYGCGSLVELDLRLEPSEVRNITRRDRPGMKPVPHAIFLLDQAVVLEAPE